MYVTHAEIYIQGLLTAGAWIWLSGKSPQHTEKAQAALVVVVVVEEEAVLLLPCSVLFLYFFCILCFPRVPCGKKRGPGPLLCPSMLAVLPSVPPRAHVLSLPSWLYFWSISLEMHTAPLCQALGACLVLPVLYAMQRWWEGDS